jgi:hypothetical protein
MTYIPGNHWMICDRCGFKYRRSEMRKEWNGAWVCEADFEPRHPQDYMVRGRKDNQRPPVVRPQPTDYDPAIGTDEVTQDDL